MIRDKIPVESYFREERERSGAKPVPRCTMLIDEVESIWAAIVEQDEWQPLYSKISAIRSMGDALRSGVAAM